MAHSAPRPPGDAAALPIHGQEQNQALDAKVVRDVPQGINRRVAEEIDDVCVLPSGSSALPVGQTMAAEVTEPTERIFAIVLARGLVLWWQIQRISDRTC